MFEADLINLNNVQLIETVFAYQILLPSFSPKWTLLCTSFCHNLYFLSTFRLYVNYRLLYGIEKQFKAFVKGFTELVPLHLIKMFDEREMEVSYKAIDNSRT